MVSIRPRSLLVLAACVSALGGGSAAASALASPRTTKPSPTTTKPSPATTTTTTTTTPTTSVATTPTTTTTVTSDATSDRSALSDYLQYLKALVTGASSGVARDETFTERVKKRCAGVLEPLTAVAPADISATALSDLGEEIGGDLAIEYLSEADAPFAHLSMALEALEWRDPAPEQAIDALLNAEGAVLALTSSALCADARTLAARPDTVPKRTLAFLGLYLTDSATLKSQLSDFLSVLSRYATTNDNRLISQINELVARFAASSAGTEHKDASAILGSLGLTS